MELQQKLKPGHNVSSWWWHQEVPPLISGAPLDDIVEGLGATGNTPTALLRMVVENVEVRPVKKWLLYAGLDQGGSIADDEKWLNSRYMVFWCSSQ